MKCSYAAFGEQNKTDKDCKCQQVYKSQIQRDFKDNQAILAVGRSAPRMVVVLCVVENTRIA